MLFASGACIGLIFPFGKIAVDLGLSPLVYAGTSAAGASAVLAVVCRILGKPIVLDASTLVYAAIAGPLTFAIPFATMLLVIPHLGSAIPAILQSLTPILTLGLVAALGVERPNLLRVAGLLIGLAGTMVILIERNSDSAQNQAHLGWYLLALVTPATLAVGNIFRTTHWPAGHGPLPLAMLTLAGAAVGVALLASVLPLLGFAPSLALPSTVGFALVALQSLAIGIGYAFYFRLQQVGGPVYLSQISYVNTSVGVAFAVLFFSERLSLHVWIAVGLILAGVALVNRGAPDEE
ncbi:DMT family transporter [Hyphomicrobium sp. CS1GBMeth3]|uniref:EamA family transporter n=1 Tax=Hyphomicrobium sp. CS1GBMeth3 TaxID=1892845 RepID=UPI000A9D588A